MNWKSKQNLIIRLIVLGVLAVPSYLLLRHWFFPELIKGGWCAVLGIITVITFPVIIFSIVIVNDFAKTSKPPRENYTYWEFSLNASERDIPMIVIGYLFIAALIAFYIYLLFFSCAFGA